MAASKGENKEYIKGEKCGVSMVALASACDYFQLREIFSCVIAGRKLLKDKGEDFDFYFRK